MSKAWTLLNRWKTKKAYEMRSRRPLASFGDVVNRCIMLRDRYVATGYNSEPTVAVAVPTGNSWIGH